MFEGSLFKPIKSISTEQVRNIIREKTTDEYCLLDVRQPAEYAEKHIPGAMLIPLGQLQERLTALDTAKPVIVYCRSGNRSSSAVGLLNGAGLDDVFNMEGGMLAYDGLTAIGPPEAGIFCFPENMQPDELVAMAWYIEDGTQRFLDLIAKQLGDPETRDLIARLSDLKSDHKDDLTKLHGKLAEPGSNADFPGAVLARPPADVMAGCVSVPEAIDWSRDKKGTDILELMMSLEANTLDLYLKLARRVRSERARSVFKHLSEQEKEHLDALAVAFEKTL
jgi:rhodanese-related sulfurtransferase/rubrerythrin